MSIENYLIPVQEFCKSIGLEIESMIIKRINEARKSNKISIKYLNEQSNAAQSDDNRIKIIKALQAKDEANCSDKGYVNFRKYLDFVNIPSIKKILKVRKEVNGLFSIKESYVGFYNTPIQKIEYVCKQFIKEYDVVHNNTFILKLAGDGTSITKSNVTILNFAFTVINDYKKAKGVDGNYSLGN